LDLEVKATTALVDVAATYRLTRLIIADEITTEARDKALEGIDRLQKKHPKLAEKLEYMLDCPWCVSVWAGAVIFTLRRVNPELADLISGLLAASLVSGALHENEYRWLPGRG